MFMVCDTGKRQKFVTGAIRDTNAGRGRFDLLPAYAILRLAKHYEAGSNKYPERNWEKGQPLSRFIDSALRHLFSFMDGDRTEDHLAAVLWNVAGYVWTERQVCLGRLPKSLLDANFVKSLPEDGVES